MATWMSTHSARRPGNTFKAAVGDADSNSNYRPQIIVYDPNGNQVGTGATGFTASSETVTYSVPGTKLGHANTVVVQSAGGNTLGTYDLDLVVALPPSQAPDAVWGWQADLQQGKPFRADPITMAISTSIPLRRPRAIPSNWPLRTRIPAPITGRS